SDWKFSDRRSERKQSRAWSAPLFMRLIGVIWRWHIRCSGRARMRLSLPAMALAAAIALDSSSSGAAPSDPNVPSSPDVAPAPSPPVFTIDQAIAYARGHQPTLAAARARYQAAALEADVPSAQWLPQFGALAEVVGATVNNSTATTL